MFLFRFVTQKKKTTTLFKKKNVRYFHYPSDNAGYGNIACVYVYVCDQRSAGSEGQWKESAGLVREPHIVSTVAVRCLAFHTAITPVYRTVSYHI